MDNSDLQRKDGRPIHYPVLLPPQLWGDTPCERRSSVLTPRYLHRYAGLRRGRVELTSHTYWELTFAFSGSGTLLVPERAVDLHGCGAILIPSGMLHGEQAAEPWDTLWIGLEGSLLQELEPQLHVLTRATDLATLAEQLWRWSQRQVGTIGPELDAGVRLLVQATVRLSRLAQQDRDPGWLQRVLDAIHNRLDEPLEMSDLARLAGFSVGHFQRRFKLETGLTPLAYLTRQRLERALVHVRESDEPIHRIARLVGFRDPLYFSRVFHRRYRVSPMQIRRDARGPATSRSETCR